MPPRRGSTALAERPGQAGLAQLEQVVIRGDLSVLTEAERIGYYARVCDSLGINPLTRPFEYLTLNNRLVLYARKDATDQLRSIKGISVDRLEREQSGDLATVTCYGHDRDNRTDAAMGAVNIKGLVGEALANALMKAETKAKRRMTLSLAGLGWLDESEIGSVDERATVSGPTVTTRAEAVEARAEALPDPAEPAPPADPQPNEQAQYTGTVVEPDQIPFEQPARRTTSGDPWMRRIHALGAERGLDHDAIHQLAADRLGVASLNDLDPYQRADLVQLLEGIDTPAVVVEDAAGGEGAGAVSGDSGGTVPAQPPAPAPTDAPAGTPAGEGAPEQGTLAGAPIEQPQQVPTGPPRTDSQADGSAPAAVDEPAATLSPPQGGAPAIPDDELRARYAWGAQRGFDDEQLDEAAIGAVGVSPLEADDATWKAFTVTVTAGAVTAPPPKPGSQAYKALPSGLDRAEARHYWQQRTAAQAG